MSKLNRSCSNCTTSKLKCDSNLPCARCSSKQLECYYVPRKKRTLKVESETAAGKRAVKKPFKPIDDNPLTSGLLPHEKTSLETFFTLYKNLVTKCSRFFFVKQFLRMQAYLRSVQNMEALARLEKWTSHIEVDLNNRSDTQPACLNFIENTDWAREIYKDRAHVHLHASADHHSPTLGSWDVDVTTPASFELRKSRVDNEALVKSNDPTARLFMCDIQPSSLVVNQSFFSMFGIDGKDVGSSFAWTGGSGLLPWGGDILARLACPVDELVTYIEVMAIKVVSVKCPNRIPSVRVTPFVQVFTLKTTMGVKSVLVKMTFTESFRVGGVIMDIAMSFEIVDSEEPELISDYDSEQKSTGTSEPAAGLDANELELPVLGGDVDDDQFFEDLLDWARLDPKEEDDHMHDA